MTKTFSFAAVHFTVAFSVAYLMSGSIWVGGAIALVEPMINTVAYHFHEKIWNRYGNSSHHSGASIRQQHAHSHTVTA